MAIKLELDESESKLAYRESKSTYRRIRSCICGPLMQLFALYIFIFILVMAFSIIASGAYHPNSRESSEISPRAQDDDPPTGYLSYKQIAGIVFAGIVFVEVVLSAVFYYVLHRNPLAEAAARKQGELEGDSWQSCCQCIWWPWKQSGASDKQLQEEAEMSDPLSMRNLSVSDIEANTSG